MEDVGKRQIAKRNCWQPKNSCLNRLSKTEGTAKSHCKGIGIDHRPGATGEIHS